MDWVDLLVLEGDRVVVLRPGDFLESMSAPNARRVRGGRDV